MKRSWLYFVVVMSFAKVTNAQVTGVGEKEKDVKGDVVEFVRFTSRSFNVYLVSPKDGILNTDVQVGIQIPFFKSLSVGVGGAGTNSFTDRISFGLWGGGKLVTSSQFSFRWAIGRATVNEKGLTTRWFFPVNHQRVKELSLAPQVFYNSVPEKNVLDLGVGIGVEKWGWQFLTTFWNKQGTWFLVRKTFKGKS